MLVSSSNPYWEVLHLNLLQLKFKNRCSSLRFSLEILASWFTNLVFVSNSIFKVAFNLWNERGMSFANSFISASLRTHHPCVHVLPKKDKRTYVAIARSTPPLSGANRVPLCDTSGVCTLKVSPFNLNNPQKGIWKLI